MLNIYLLFWLYAVLGWVMETALVSIQSKRFVNRGFLMGPYCPIYGTGGVLLLSLDPYKNSPFLVFILAIIICSIVEYLTSYILEIIMSFGIIGILSYICIVCITLKNGFKLKNNKTILPLFIGFVMIFLHSMMDFDMSYLIMIILYFLFISIINIEDKKINKNTNIIECILIFIFSIITIGNICGTITSFNNGNINIAPWIEQYQFNDIVCKNMSNEQKIEKIKQYIKNEPYSQQNSIYEIWGNLLLELDETEKKKNIDLLIQVLKNVTPERLYNIVQTQKRTDIIMNIYEKSGQEPKGLLEIVVSEYKDTAFRIIEYDKNLMGKVASEMTLENYKDTYEKALKLLRNSIDNNDLK